MHTFKLISGDTMPMLGLGTWLSTESEITKAILHALEIGYRHIDCAPIYLNEPAIGKALKLALKQYNLSRDEVWITSKLWNSFHYPKDVLPALEKTLRDLQLDYLDLYLMHWPVAFKPEVGLAIPDSGAEFVSLDVMPLTDTWQAMEALVKKGLVKNIGVSNFSKLRLTEILTSASIKPAVNQVECHPYLQQKPLLDFCNTHNIALTAYSPLGSKARPANFMKSGEPNLLENKNIVEIAETHAATPAQVLLAWQLQRNIIVIPKSTNSQRISENFKAQTLNLSDSEIQAINQLNLDYRYLDGEFWALPGSPYEVKTLWKEASIS